MECERRLFARVSQPKALQKITLNIYLSRVLLISHFFIANFIFWKVYTQVTPGELGWAQLAAMANCKGMSGITGTESQGSEITYIGASFISPKNW